MAAFDMEAAIQKSQAWLNNDIKVRIRHPSFGYVTKITHERWTGAKWGAEFSHDAKEAAIWTCWELRAPQDANGNGTMALLVASYGGLAFEFVTVERLANI